MFSQGELDWIYSLNSFGGYFDKEILIYGIYRHIVKRKNT